MNGYDNYFFGCDRNLKHEKIKYKAVLYIRLHFDELIKKEAYRTTYYKIIDQYARECFYIEYNKTLVVVTEKEREIQSSTLDIEIEIKGKQKIESYKKYAEYIVEWLQSGKSLIKYM